MAHVIQTEFTKGGTRTIFARVKDQAGDPITQAGTSSVEYSVYELDDLDDDAQSVVTGHDGETIAVGDCIFDSYQTDDDRWTADSTGYNFRHTIDVSSYSAFPVRGKRYLVEFIITPTSGQPVRLQAVGPAK